MNEKRLFLLDAYALIFRAYYALIKMPRLTQDGFNTSAIFGFVNTLEEVLRKEKPSHIAICFDPAGPTFRSEADASYKAQRESTPEDIKLSVPIIKEIIRAYNIPILEVEGFEADDVIGTMAKRAEKEGFTTYMMTPDKDFGQLVSPTVLQYKPSYRGQDFEIRGEEEVCARYGIERTSQVIDLLALMGDKIDNIPGCPGVGEKTAIKLITEFGSVEQLLENIGSLKGALKKKVEENAEQIRASYFLATIRTDVPVEADPESLVRKPEDTERLFAIFKELEFKTLRDRVSRRLDSARQDVKEVKADSFPSSLFDFDTPGNVPESSPLEIQTAETSGLSWRVVRGKEEAGKLAESLFPVKRCGICFVAEGENDMDCLIKGVAVACSESEAVYVPADDAECMAVVLDTLSRNDILKISAQVKRDYVLASRLRTDEAPAIVNYNDISVAHYLLQPEMRHDVETLSALYLNYSCRPAPVLTAKRGSKTPPAGEEEIAAWATERAVVTMRLEAPLSKEIENEGMLSLLNEVELPLSTVLAEMEIAGVRIDVKALDEAARDLEKRLAEIEKDVYELAGEEFNVGSPAKVGEILFDKLQLDPKAKKTKTGQYSTSEDVLEKVAHKNPIVGKILEYRQLKKLLSTYLTALPAAINPATGKVHTVYNQTVTATGRISSSSPNLQNIPVREDEGRGIRRAFIADDGHLFLSADYSQIELRLVADFANDETMLDAFHNDKDIHSITAAKIYHKSPEDVSADERRHAKTANFGILYGISAFGLASRLGIPRSDAKELIDNYFATFPTIRKYMSDAVEKARENGYVSTAMGRKRRLPDINSKNPVVRGYAERNAVNAPIQGAAADIIKVAMVDIFLKMREKKMKSKMIMQVHDELNFDVVAEELPEMQRIVTEGMENAYSGRVRLTASCGVATNWLDAH
uniref:DNA polymerase I n=1 Tax=uncultured Muribaculaceae bacterium TaxID=2301481 RepID=A0A6G8F439_9BACT|nr:DNA polymerase I [uncultured Muribaculaceae bacterium]